MVLSSISNMNKWLKEEEKRMNEKIKKLCLIFMVLIVCGLSITSKAYANDTKEDPKFPTVEEIMRDYQVSEEEAIMILESMKKENSLYQDKFKTGDTDSRSISTSEQYKLLLEAEAKIEIEENRPEEVTVSLYELQYEIGKN